MESLIVIHHFLNFLTHCCPPFTNFFLGDIGVNIIDAFLDELRKCLFKLVLVERGICISFLWGGLAVSILGALSQEIICKVFVLYNGEVSGCNTFAAIGGGCTILVGEDYTSAQLGLQRLKEMSLVRTSSKVRSSVNGGVHHLRVKDELAQGGVILADKERGADCDSSWRKH